MPVASPSGEGGGVLHTKPLFLPVDIQRPLFSFSFFKSSGGWEKIKLKLPRFHVSDTYMCFDLTYAPVATAAPAAATGLVSMSTQPDPE